MHADAKTDNKTAQPEPLIMGWTTFRRAPGRALDVLRAGRPVEIRRERGWLERFRLVRTLPEGAAVELVANLDMIDRKTRAVYLAALRGPVAISRYELVESYLILIWSAMPGAEVTWRDFGGVEGDD